MSKKYNHAFTLAFDLETTASCEDDDDYPTSDEMAAAIMKRLANLIENNELEEAVGAPFDTMDYSDTGDEA